jgi:hypothetical protein
MKSSGSCLCGKVSFTVDKILPSIGHCHCIMCQKFHGAAFSTFAEVKLDDLHWLTGEDKLQVYQAENDTVRKFCQVCGSSLIFESKYNRQAKTLEIALASFDSFPHVTPDAHIYTQTKVNWLILNDNITQYLAYRK